METLAVKTDFFELGEKTALICAEPGVRDVLGAALKELGFKFHQAETSELAIERLRYNRYDCVLIHESFAGSTLRTNPVLSYVAPLPMSIRRNWFVTVIGSSFKTLDAMQAFGESVHLVVNPVDLTNLVAILKKGLAEFETKYHVYRNVAAAEGDR
jgi:DNA-binding NtrC family response regulator